VNASGTLPNLAGAWIRSSERVGDRLRLEVENLRRGGLVYAGEVMFTGVTDIDLASDRPMDRPPSDPRPIGMIVEVHSASGATMLDTQNQSCPGEMDSLHFTIRHASVEVRLRPSVTRTLRRMAGLYPRSSDLRG
jgi:hypothetical protein